MLVVPATPGESESLLTVISPVDMEWHQNCAKHIGPDELPTFWEDRMLVNRAATYMHIFCNPENFVVDINGEGVMGFQVSPNRIRAWVFMAVWGPKAKHRPNARRVAAKAAFLSLGVQRLEALTNATNVQARKACEDSGMNFRGLIPRSLWYNGERVTAAWFELDREDDFGLPPLEE